MRTIRAGSGFVTAASGVLSGTLYECLQRKPRVSLALSGGRTPWPVLRSLGEAALDWERVDIYQVDERVAPLGDPARNLTGLATALLDRVPAVVHPMPVDAPELEAEAARYAAAAEQTSTALSSTRSSRSPTANQSMWP